jgi:membrane-associated phospholipid phosphatase
MKTNLYHTHNPLEDLPRTRAQKLVRAITSYYFFALLIALGFASLFSWLADAVNSNKYGDINRTILLAIHAHQSDSLNRLALDTTWFGSFYGVLTLSAALALALAILKHYVELGMFAAVLLGATLMIFILKIHYHNPRPLVFPPLVIETNFSFPSGHSLASFAIWGFFAWWIVSVHPRNVWRWLLGALGILVAVMIALSRLYLGVHWPTDVLAGFFLGFGWVATCALGHRWLTRHARRERKKQLHAAWLARQKLA